MKSIRKKIIASFMAMVVGLIPCDNSLACFGFIFLKVPVINNP